MSDWMMVDSNCVVTQASPLEGESRIEELAQMLGVGGEGATLSAQEILAGVAEVKTKVAMQATRPDERASAL